MKKTYRKRRGKLMGMERLRFFLRGVTQGIARHIKSVVSLRVLLFILSGALACTAAAYAYGLWHEGVRAEQNAKEILQVSGFATLNPAAGVKEDAYQQPQEPAADPNALQSLFDSVLDGYSVVARLDIPSIGITLPVLSETTDTALKYSVCYFSGPEPGGEGNIVITGHNYASGAHFGNLDEIKTGDTVDLTAPDGKEFAYTVYKTEMITPDDVEALSDTQHDKELTLLTCEQNGNRRLLVRCFEAGGQQ